MQQSNTTQHNNLTLSRNSWPDDKQKYTNHNDKFPITEKNKKIVPSESQISHAKQYDAANKFDTKWIKLQSFSPSVNN